MQGKEKKCLYVVLALRKTTKNLYQILIMASAYYVLLICVIVCIFCYTGLSNLYYVTLH